MGSDRFFDKFKPIINELVQYYYEYLNNSSGGNLHIALDDGNLSDEHIWSCQRMCLDSGDQIGFLIGAILRCFPEEEREQMYKNYWGINTSTSRMIFSIKHNGEI